MTRRLTSSSLAGTSRKLVAVGTPRLASMLATMRAAAPRSGSPGSSRPSFPAFPAAAGAGAAVARAGASGAGVAGAGAGAVGAGAAAAPPGAGGAVAWPSVAGDGRAGAAWSPSRRESAKNSCPLSLTELGFSRYCSYISSTSQALGPRAAVDGGWSPTDAIVPAEPRGRTPATSGSGSDRRPGTVPAHERAVHLHHAQGEP